MRSTRSRFDTFPSVDDDSSGLLNSAEFTDFDKSFTNRFEVALSSKLDMSKDGKIS